MGTVKSFNPLGDSNRKQWHSVVNLLRMYNHDDNDGFESICKELDRYIDWAEDILDTIREENENGN